MRILTKNENPRDKQRIAEMRRPAKKRKKKLLVSLCWTNLATLESAHFINKTIKKNTWRWRHSPQQ